MVSGYQRSTVRTYNFPLFSIGYVCFLQTTEEILRPGLTLNHLTLHPTEYPVSGVLFFFFFFGPSHAESNQIQA